MKRVLKSLIRTNTMIKRLLFFFSILLCQTDDDLEILPYVCMVRYGSISYCIGYSLYKYTLDKNYSSILHM